MNNQTSIIVFIKNPKLGYVKTRLAKDVGDEKALDIYLQLTDHTRLQLEKTKEVNRHVYYSDFIDEADAWSQGQFIKGIQANGDLGDRIKGAFSEVFAHSDKAIIIGSDCAQLTEEHIQKAIDALDEHNVVIGPTYDGGYYLLGMDSNYTFLFEDIEWSTESVFDATKAKAVKNGLTVAEIDTLSDIDYIENWEKYGKSYIGPLR